MNADHNVPEAGVGAVQTGFLERLARGPLVFDGAMGTMLYSRGVFINTCFDDLNLSRPRLVGDIHAEYVAAGADVIETNTFGANPIKLAAFGLAERTAEINAAGVRLARAAAGAEVLVSGSAGPCLQAGQPWRAEAAPALTEAFAAQIAALHEAGIDALVLETFCHVEELCLAAGVAKQVGLPVVACCVVGTDGLTALGRPAAAALAALDGCPDVDVVGLNCGAGPGPLFDVVERVIPGVRKPFVVMPNAGMPRDVDGRMIYMTSPEYFTSYARKFVQIGVRGIGGCCGTTPEHIRTAARAVRSLSGVRKHLEVRPGVAPEGAAEPVEAHLKSRFSNRLSRGLRVTSVEILPPRSCDLTPFLEKARLCHCHGIDAVNIPDGPRASARVSPMIAAIALRREVGIEPILHYCCRDRNLIGMQSDLLGGYAAGIRNFLIITGDPPKLGDYPDATGVFDVDAIGLTQVTANLNRGIDIGGTPITPPTAIFIGVGANPCALSPETEMRRYHAKVRAGAEFAITQPVFDPDALLRFLDQAQGEGSDIPILAGVWPLVSFKNAEFMRNEVPGVVVPDAVLERMAACRTKEDGIKTGVDIARAIMDRIRDRVGGFQVSAPFGRVDIALDVLA